MLIISTSDSNFASIMIPVIAAVFIFNFTALHTLVQTCYSKYKSIFLIKEIFNFFNIFVAIIIPGLCVIIFILLNPSYSHFKFLSVCSIIYCIGSSIWLIHKTKHLQNQNRIVKKLLFEINDSEIFYYKNNEISTTENRIDILEKIIISLIRDKDTNSAEDIFNLVFEWINNIIDKIPSDCDIYVIKKNNRFCKFFENISDEVFKCRNKIIQERFIITMNNKILINSKIKNLRSYEYIFDAITNLIINGLYTDDYQNEDVLTTSFNLLLISIPYYLYEMDESEKAYKTGKDFYFLSESEDFRKFDNILYTKIDKIIQTASELNRINFLKSLRLFNYLFEQPKQKYNGPFEPGKIYPSYSLLKLRWNTNYYQLMKKISGTYFSIFYNIENKKQDFNKLIWSRIIDDYHSFLFHFQDFDFNNKLHKVIFDRFVSSYKTILFEILTYKEIMPSFEFYETLCSFNECYEKTLFPNFIQIFIDFTDKYFEYYFEKELNQNERNSTWNKLRQFQEEQKEALFSELLKEHIKKLETKYSNYLIK